MADEAQGPGDIKLWASTQVQAKIEDFKRRLRTEPKAVSLDEISNMIWQWFVGQAEQDAWSRYLTSLASEPYYQFIRRDGRDGKLHRYRISWGFDNPAVAEKFVEVLDGQLRIYRLKADPITALGMSLGDWRQRQAEKRKIRPKGGGVRQL